MADKSSSGTHLCVPPLDPRTTSTQSLTPSYADEDQGLKRRLLVIYIHGFVGSEASFHSFPFHVHMRLKEQLAATHAIHSKIYPRYKTYKAFHLATENLSRWLSEHEDPNSDIVLVGHSMGGLLAEEVVLLRNGNNSVRKHRILGIVHMDAPLLGARNRVILAGVMSPFRSKAGVFAVQQASVSTVSVKQSHSIENLPSRQHKSSDPPQSRCLSSDENAPKTDCRPDPLFNPPFANDVLIQNRSWWENVQHFARKHKNEGFVPASFNHWAAHFEFGSYLLNPKRLRVQYTALRKLDDIEPGTVKAHHAGPDGRVRFVQFYTASYKGRAGKRYIDKTYLRESQRSESPVENHGQSGTFDDEDKVDEDAGKSQMDDNFEEQASDLEELHFCKLARRSGGEVDPLWKKIMMATNDEVNAHTILFMPGPHYGDLVERTCNEIADWISDCNP